MGYTHYYYGLGRRHPAAWRAIFPSLVTDTGSLLAAFGPAKIGGPEGDGGEAILNDRTISFNGIGDDSHETFTLRSNGEHPMGFTKTARKPYDELVTAVLIRAVYRLGADSQESRGIGSDGYWEEWMPGRELVKRVFPNDEVVRPPEVMEMDRQVQPTPTQTVQEGSGQV